MARISRFITALFVALLLAPLSWAQGPASLTYDGGVTNVTAIPYPNTIRCPDASGTDCSGTTLTEVVCAAPPGSCTATAQGSSLPSGFIAGAGAQVNGAEGMTPATFIISSVSGNQFSWSSSQASGTYLGGVASLGGQPDGSGACWQNEFGIYICRVTDGVWPLCNGSANSGGFITSSVGSAESHQISVDDTRIVFQVVGNATCAAGISVSPTAIVPTALYGTTDWYDTHSPGGSGCGAVEPTSSNISAANNSGHEYFYAIVMDGGTCNGSANGDLYVARYDIASTSSPTQTLLYDVTTACGLTSGAYYDPDDEVSVMGSDQQFGFILQTGAGQTPGGIGFAIYDVTQGCRILWTNSASIVNASGSTWTAPTGSVSGMDEFYIHQARQVFDGGGVELTVNSCITTANGCTVTSKYFWQPNTTTVEGTGGTVTGHTTVGNTHYVDRDNETNPPNALAIGPIATPLSLTILQAIFPSGQPTTWTDDHHMGWWMDNSSDTNPFCGDWSLSSPNPAFYTLYAWDNELTCQATNGTGTTWRFSHTFSTGQNGNFSAEFAIGNGSSDGTLWMWSTDYACLLGSVSPKAGSDCRSDVFMAILPAVAGPAPGQPIAPSKKAFARVHSNTVSGAAPTHTVTAGDEE